jgi:hypothetical protein
MVAWQVALYAGQLHWLSGPDQGVLAAVAPLPLLLHNSTFFFAMPHRVFAHQEKQTMRHLMRMTSCSCGLACGSCGGTGVCCPLHSSATGQTSNWVRPG